MNRRSLLKAAALAPVAAVAARLGVRAPCPVHYYRGGYEILDITPAGLCLCPGGKGDGVLWAPDENRFVKRVDFPTTRFESWPSVA